MASMDVFFERKVAGRTSVGSAAATVGELAIVCTSGPAAGSIAARVAVIRCGLPWRASSWLAARARLKESNTPASATRIGDHRRDPEQAHQRPSRRAREVPEGHLGEARAGQVQPFEQRRQADAGGRERSDPDRVDGADADGAGNRVGGCEERDGKAECGGARVDAGQQRGLPDGERQEVLEGAAKDLIENQPDADSGSDSE